MSRIVTVAVAAALTVSMAACSNGSASSTAARAKQGDGSTSDLAHKLQVAKLGCGDYADVPQDPNTFSGAGVRDIGNCNIGHLAVFSNAQARDRWGVAQVTTAKMRGCVTGTTWAVCIFPKSRVTDAQVHSALKGVTTS